MKKIVSQTNKYFNIVENKELDCFDIFFKKVDYTSAELHSIVDYIFTLAKNTEDAVRFAHAIEEKKQPPKIIMQ